MKSNIHNMALYETTLINLRILRSLEPGFRLDTTQRLFQVHQKRSQLVPTWFTRWWSSQDRRSDVSRIQLLFHQAHQCSENTEGASKKRMIEYIRDSVEGLKNLQTTYRTDLTMTALIDVILDQIKHQDPLTHAQYTE
jgi:hypothetical protein|tara:strand:- start:305 stop:718 length:414 start_codon:yes stop_codon:yes gene_type:complete